MSDIKISVVVPCYNVEKFLPRCLDSLVNQTLKEIEIICVNDASPDNGIRILREYESRYNNIRVIDLKENVCLGGARNRGIEVARGEYIAFVDSDDWVKPEMYETLYKKALETNADVAACDFQRVNNLGEVYVEHIDKPVGVVRFADISNYRIGFSPVWNKIIRKDFWDRHEIRFPEHLFYEDMYVVMIMDLSLDRYIHVHIPLYNYFANLGSITQSKDVQKYFQHFTILEMSWEYARLHGLSQAHRKCIDHFFLGRSMMHLRNYLLSFPCVDYGIFKTEVKRVRKSFPSSWSRIWGNNLFCPSMRLKILLLHYFPLVFFYLMYFKKQSRTIKARVKLFNQTYQDSPIRFFL